MCLATSESSGQVLFFPHSGSLIPDSLVPQAGSSNRVPSGAPRRLVLSLSLFRRCWFWYQRGPRHPWEVQTGFLLPLSFLASCILQYRSTGRSRHPSVPEILCHLFRPTFSFPWPLIVPRSEFPQEEERHFVTFLVFCQNAVNFSILPDGLSQHAPTRSSSSKTTRVHDHALFKDCGLAVRPVFHQSGRSLAPRSRSLTQQRAACVASVLKRPRSSSPARPTARLSHAQTTAKQPSEAGLHSRAFGVTWTSTSWVSFPDRPP